jgi:N-acetylglucosaminyldiphosphoundecaprenol N-acetyl-beta-D-mannosaminyltransferase
VSLGSLPIQKSAQSKYRPDEQEPLRSDMSNGNGDGHSLICGRLHLYSVPLEYLFAPKTNALRIVVPTNAEVYVLAHEDRKFAEILAETVNTIDGRVLQGICKLLYPKHKIVRQNGSNFISDLAEHCRNHGQRLFLLGASEKSNALAAQRLRDKFPGLEISGFSPPLQNHPFPEDWNQTILKQIEGFAPYHVGVSFGPMKQEFWIYENASRLEALGVRCAYGLGGTMDFLSGLKPRAPKWIEFIGTEWLFRLACEPRARFRRTLTMFRMPFYAARTAREIKPVGDYSGE